MPYVPGSRGVSTHDRLRAVFDKAHIKYTEEKTMYGLSFRVGARVYFWNERLNTLAEIGTNRTHSLAATMDVLQGLHPDIVRMVLTSDAGVLWRYVDEVEIIINDLIVLVRDRKVSEVPPWVVEDGCHLPGTIDYVRKHPGRPSRPSVEPSADILAWWEMLQSPKWSDFQLVLHLSDRPLARKIPSEITKTELIELVVEQGAEDLL